MKKISILFLFFSHYTSAQTDSIKTLKIAIGAELGVYATTMYGLNKLWYADYPRSSFHWHNDNYTWLQMDKLGHAYSAYQVGLLGIDIMKWSGVPEKKAIWYGGAYGAVFLTTIEILDGYSAEWGASWGDLLANTSGSTLLIAQELLWKEQRLQFKYTFYPTKYADSNPELLGKNTIQQMLKDYNAQTIWLSCNLHGFMPKSKLPKWLNIAVGYGGDGMTSGTLYDQTGIIEEGGYVTNPRTRQFYLSLDINLRKVDSGNEFFNKALKVLGFIKLPSPAIMFNNKKNLVVYPLYYGQ